MSNINNIQNAEDENIARKIIDENDCFCFDCDGVLWQGPKRVEGASEVIGKLKGLGKKIIYVTNNSTKSTEEYVQKLKGLGFPANESNVIGTAYTSALCASQIVNKNDERVYVVGNESMGKELDKLGVSHFGVGPDTEITSQIFDTSKPLDPKVTAVIVGMDGHFHFSKIAKAASYLKRPSCKFIATNEDPQLPIGGSEYMVPGTGALVTCVAVAAGRDPDIICGKPHSFMGKCIQNLRNLEANRTIMIGDRLSTDIEFGKNCGFQTLAVLTGCTDFDLLQKVSSSKDEQCKRQTPDYYLNTIADLNQFL